MEAQSNAREHGLAPSGHERKAASAGCSLGPKYSYTIGDKTYVQRPLVLLQIDQLTELLSQLVIPASLDVQSIVFVLGRHTSRALAIVLLEDDAVKGKSKAEIGRYLLSRDMEAIANEIRCTVDPETIAQVVEDFFDCNPIVSIIEKFGGLGEKLRAKLPKRKEALSSSSSAPSPEGTSPNETTSSADTPSKTANRT